MSLAHLPPPCTLCVSSCPLTPPVRGLSCSTSGCLWPHCEPSSWLWLSSSLSGLHRTSAGTASAPLRLFYPTPENPEERGEVFILIISVWHYMDPNMLHVGWCKIPVRYNRSLYFFLVYNQNKSCYRYWRDIYWWDCRLQPAYNWQSHPPLPNLIKT